MQSKIKHTLSKYKKIFTIKLLYILILILMLTINLWFIIFLYKNYFTPNKEMKSISPMQKEVFINEIDTETLEKIITEIEEQKNRDEIDLETLRNPFLY